MQEILEAMCHFDDLGIELKQKPLQNAQKTVLPRILTWQFCTKVVGTCYLRCNGFDSH